MLLQIFWADEQSRGLWLEVNHPQGLLRDSGTARISSLTKKAGSSDPAASPWFCCNVMGVWRGCCLRTFLLCKSRQISLLPRLLQPPLMTGRLQ